MSLTDTSQVDLVSIIERESGLSFPTRVHNLRDGDEWQGPCPWCGGENRFHIWPDAMLPHYWCRHCEKFGDAIEFLKEYKGLFYAEACDELGISPGEQYIQKRRSATLVQEDGPPSQKWQEFAENIATHAEKYLWTAAGKDALDYLRGRGLHDDTIKAARLGYFPLDQQGKWYSRPFSDWGLDPEQLTESQRTKECVKVPDGILIPWRASGQLWKLTVKRFTAKAGELKYGQILGSKDCLYNADAITPTTPALLTEAVIDALSAQQEASDLVTTHATDSTTGARSPRWIARLSLASHVLVGFDDEENKAGRKGAQFWLDVFPRHAMRWLPWSKDINDMLKEGKDIRSWIQMGLKLVARPIPERTTEPMQAVPVHRCIIRQPLPCTAPATYQDITGVWWCEEHAGKARYLDSISYPPDPPCAVGGCQNPIEYVDETDHFYCQSHWEQFAGFTWMTCPKCNTQVFCQEFEHGVCERCWFDSLTSTPALHTSKQQKDWSEYW